MRLENSAAIFDPLIIQLKQNGYHVQYKNLSSLELCPPQIPHGLWSNVNPRCEMTQNKRSAVWQSCKNVQNSALLGDHVRVFVRDLQLATELSILLEILYKEIFQTVNTKGRYSRKAAPWLVFCLRGWLIF
jgi:hypothetical protein